MASDDAAHQAISSLNGTMLGNRTIRVNEAQPRTERSSGGRGGYGGGGGGYCGGGGGGYRGRGFGRGGVSRGPGVGHGAVRGGHAPTAAPGGAPRKPRASQTVQQTP